MNKIPTYNLEVVDVGIFIEEFCTELGDGTDHDDLLEDISGYWSYGDALDTIVELADFRARLERRLDLEEVAFAFAWDAVVSRLPGGVVIGFGS